MIAAHILALCFAPRLAAWAPVAALARALSRTPVRRKLLALPPFDVESSHLPAMPGLRGGAIQQVRFELTPRAFVPDLALPERVGGFYRPRFLVHYTIQADRITFSTLCFTPEAQAVRERFSDALETHLRACAEAGGGQGEAAPAPEAFIPA